MPNSAQSITTSYMNTLLSPNGVFVHIWDNLILTSIIANALIVGFQASFNSSVLWLWIISYLLDVLFMMDVLLQFFLGYNDKGINVTKVSKTAKHYAKTILIIDILSIIPFELLGAIPMIGPSYYVVALARLNRTIRIYRIFWLVLKNQSSLGTNFKFIQTLKYLSYIFILLQIASCAWYSVSCKNTYLTGSTVCARDSWYHNSTLSIASNQTNASTNDVENFIVSIYWGMATITSAGFGDIVAIRTDEKIVAILFMLAGTLLFGFIVGSITSNITNADISWFLYVQRIRAIMGFMQDTEVSQPLRDKVWLYYKYLFESKHGVEDKAVRKGLPKHMQGDISMKIAQEFLDKLSLFKDANYSFYRALALEVEPSFYLPGQSLVTKGKNCDFVYYIRRGKAAIMSPENDSVQQDILNEGEIIGEMYLVYNYERMSNIVALTNCETLRVSREKLNKVLVFFPKVRHKMKEIARSSVNDAMKTCSKELINENLLSLARDTDISRSNTSNRTNLIRTQNSSATDNSTSKTSVWSHKSEATPISRKNTITNNLFLKVQKFEKLFMYGMMIVLPLWSIIVPYVAIFSSVEWHISQNVSPGYWVLYASLYILDAFLISDTLLIGNLSLDFKSPNYIISLIVEVSANLPIEIIGPVLGGSIRSFKVLWLLRLNRLLKWFKLSEYFSLLEKKLGSYIEMLRCFKYFLYLLCSTHVVACVWFAIATFEGCINPGSWASFHQLNMSHSVLHNYVTSFYFSAVTLTSTGFGDIHAHTTLEQIFVVGLSLIGFMLYGHCLGTLASTLGNNALPKVLFQEKISAVNNFLSNHKISASLRKRIERYFELFWIKWQGQSGQEHVMFDLPLPLQESMASEIQEDIIRALPIFARTDPNYMKRLCLNTITYEYSPGEIIIYAGDMGKEMYFIRRGSVEVLDETMSFAISTIGAGGYFGEEGLLFGTPRVVSIRASTYCEVIMLHKNAIDDTAEAYPLIRKQFEELVETKEHSHTALKNSAIQLPLTPDKMYPNLYNTTYSILKTLEPLVCFALPYNLTNIIINSINDDNVVNKITHPMVTPFGLGGTIKPFSLNNNNRGGGVIARESVSSIQDSIKKYLNDKYKGSNIEPVKLQEESQGWTNNRVFKRPQDVEDDNIESQKTGYMKSLERIKKIVATFMLRLSFLPTSPFYSIWELLFTILSFTSFFLVCLQAGFLPSSIPLILFNYLIDITFIIDMTLKLHTAYFDRKQHLITHPAHCAMNYFKGNFVFDLLANFPTELFLPAISIWGSTSYLKVLALLRMNRLIRIYKIPLAFGHIAKKITRTGYVFLQLEFILILFLLMHLTGTIWFLLAQSQEYFLTDMVTTFTQQSWATKQNLFHNSSTSRQYIISLYWAATATSTVGYGDIYASTVIERLYSSFVVIIGILYYGFVMANVAANIANADAQMASFKEKMMNVFFFLKDQNIDTGLQKRIMNYFKFIWGETKGINASELFKEMPLALQGDIALSLYKSLIDKVPLFNNTEIGFSKLLSLSIHPEYFPKGEYVVKKGDLGSSMYFIYRGTVDVVSEDASTIFASMGEGKFFGEISVLSQLPRTASIRAGTNCALFVLRKVDLDLALEAYPHINEQIKEEANRRLNLVKQRSKAAKEAKEKGADAKAAAEAAARAAKDKESEQSGKSETAPVSAPSESDDISQVQRPGIRNEKDWGWFKLLIKKSTTKTWDGIITKYAKWNPLKYTIHPDSKLAMAIKLIEFFLLYISTFTITFQGCFQDTGVHFLVLNYSFELCFILLMVVKFYMAYIDSDDGTLKNSLKDIAEHYLFQPLSFGLELVSLLPIEIFCLALSDSKLRLSYLLYFRIIHALRGIRIPFILSEQEKTLSSWTTYIRIFKFFVLITLCLHIVCCIWFVIGCQMSVCNPNSWAVSNSVSIANLNNGTYNLDNDIASLLDQYLTSMYWAVATMTSTGYGDIVPTQELEMMLAIVLIPIGRFVMGFILGNITSTLASLNAQKVQYESKFKIMKSYMDDLNLPANIQGRVKEFYEYCWSKNKGTNRNELLEEFPYCLRNELLGKVNDKALNGIPILSKFDANIQRHIAVLLEPILLTPGEYVAKGGDAGQEIYFIKKGTIECLDYDRRLVKTLGPGDYFGFEETFGRKPYINSHRTITHCELITFSEESLELLKEAYDTESHKVVSNVVEATIADLVTEQIETEL